MLHFRYFFQFMAVTLHGPITQSVAKHVETGLGPDVAHVLTPNQKTEATTAQNSDQITKLSHVYNFLVQSMAVMEIGQNLLNVQNCAVVGRCSGRGYATTPCPNMVERTVQVWDGVLRVNRAMKRLALLMEALHNGLITVSVQNLVRMEQRLYIEIAQIHDHSTEEKTVLVLLGYTILVIRINVLFMVDILNGQILHIVQNRAVRAHDFVTATVQILFLNTTVKTVNY